MVDYEHGHILSFTPFPSLESHALHSHTYLHFIMIFIICDPCLTTRPDGVVCPLATIQLTNRERAAI